MISTTLLYSQAPFSQYPDFETSPEGHVATGLGIADINNDGWKDIIVANGNDIHRQRLVVYYNQGDGTFPLLPDWQSSDIDYHGHLAAGDIDNDGDVDIAVSVYLGPGGFNDPGKVKVYYNTGNELESSPSFEAGPFYTFSCALGDADADGDLDLAVACGEPYSSIYDKGRIFYNENGSFYPLSWWETSINMGALDVEFGDLDQNGYLDLIFVCEDMQNFVYLADGQGVIDQDPDWTSDNPSNFMNSVDVGKVRDDGPMCFVSTGNDQLGGDGKIKQFTFDYNIPPSSAPSWESAYVGYGSGILMADINHDEYIDLLYGGWWEALSILEGLNDDWLTTPIFTASESSVVEAILMSDLGKHNYMPAGQAITPSQERGVFYLEHQIIEKVNSVLVNNVPLARGEYCYVELKNWISLKDHISNTDVVSINYEYMKDGDIVISNWDSGKGNFIFYNHNNLISIDEQPPQGQELEILALSPVPALDYIHIEILNRAKTPFNIEITDLSGRKVTSEDHSGETINIRVDVGHLNDGVYVLKLSNGITSVVTKFVI